MKFIEYSEEVESFQSTISKEALKLSEILEGYKNFSPRELVTRIITDGSNLTEAIGLKQPVVLNLSKDDDYEEWIIDIWAKRLTVYIKSLSAGISEFSGQKGLNFGDKTNTLVSMANTLNAAFPVSHSGQQALLPSLERRRDLSNYYNTYLDPHLFSALLIAKNHSNLDNRHKDILNEIIIDEIQLCFDSGTVDFFITDESTLWWALSYLLSVKKEKFNIKVGNKQYEDIDGALELCRRLINGYDVIYPTYDVSKIEITPEIYGEIRTRLLIIKNCIDILETIGTKADNDFLHSHISNQFIKVLYDKTKIKHMYHIGLSLEICSKYVKWNLNREGILEESEIQIMDNPKVLEHLERLGFGQQVIFEEIEKMKRKSLKVTKKDIVLSLTQFLASKGISEEDIDRLLEILGLK